MRERHEVVRGRARGRSLRASRAPPRGVRRPRCRREPPAASASSTAPPGKTQAPANEPRSRGRSASSTSTPRSPSRSRTTVAAAPGDRRSLVRDSRSLSMDLSTRPSARPPSAAHSAADTLRSMDRPDRGRRRRRVDPRATLVLAPNPGPMTLDGTNSFVLRAPGSPASSSSIPVRPTPAHLARLAGFGPVELVLRHPQPPRPHRVARRVRAHDGCPGRARSTPAFCIGGDPARRRRAHRGGRARASRSSRRRATRPTRCASSLRRTTATHGSRCSPATRSSAAAPRSSPTPTAPSAPTSSRSSGCGALGTPRRRGGAAGPRPGAAATSRAICDAYLAHRAERLDQVRAALARARRRRLDRRRSPTSSTQTRMPRCEVAAEASVRAQLRYLRGTA